MADDNDADDLFDDINDESEGGDDDDDGIPNAIDPDPEEPDNVDDSELIRDATAEAGELGIVIPDTIEDCRDWIEHFLTAVKTHKATKAAAGADAGAPPATAESGEQPTPEEPPMMMGTISKHHDPAVRALAASKTEDIHRRRRARIKRLEESGMFPKAVTDDLRARASKVNLSLVDEKTGSPKFVAMDSVDGEIKTMLATLAYQQGLGMGNLSLLNRAKSHDNPLEAVTKEEAETAEKLTTRTPKNVKA